MEEYKYLQLFSTSTNHNSNQCGTPEKSAREKDMEVTITVGGREFVTRESSLKSIPDSLLSNLDDIAEFYDVKKNSYMFDRDPDMFKEVLEAHRNGELHVPRDVCPFKFRRELQFWKIPISMLMPCCWKYFYESESELAALDNIIQCRAQPASLKTVGDISQEDERQIKACMAKHMSGKVLSEKPEGAEKPPQTCSYKIWLLLEEPTSSTAAKIWCFFYIFMVLVSVVVFLLWTEEDYRVEPYLSENVEPPPQMIQLLLTFNERVQKLVVLDPHPALFALDCITTLFFTVESLVLLLVCPQRLSLIKSPLYIMKVFVCLAMMISLLFDLRRDMVTSYTVGKFYATLKALSVLRLLLIFRIKKLYTRLQIVLLSLENGAKDLLLLIFVFILTIIIHGGMIYCLEFETESFPNTRAAFWWALITMTTIGYGDYYPTSGEGQLAAAFCAIQGLIVIALPIAAIASTFATFYCRWSDLDTHIAAIKAERDDKVKQEKGKLEKVGEVNDNYPQVPTKNDKCTLTDS